ncbi:MAG: diaminopimelate epimerase [Limisphaera sp.]|nr:diaminopimelate epimerase [Limisphaera sp.]
MVLQFWKMNGAGNDFILFDNRAGEVSLTPALIRRLCDRHRGVGADGIIGLRRCESGRADWAWEFYNSDGSCAEMCGNGARCFARFIQRVTGWARDTLSFETLAGVGRARLEDACVAVDLTPPMDLRLGLKLHLSTGPAEVHAINTGVPHAVLFVEDADRAAVSTLGPELRWHPEFAPRGTNVNFVQVLEPGRIRVRTFERGVEGETLACGTGVTASALITALQHDFASPVRVRVQSGDTLEVRFERRGNSFDTVQLSGPAEFVFEGRIEL